jgi:hypothetical protein
MVELYTGDAASSALREAAGEAALEPRGNEQAAPARQLHQSALHTLIDRSRDG